MSSGSPSPSSSPGRKGVMTPSRSPSMSILPDIRDEVNPALIQAKMVLERLQEAQKQRDEEKQRVMLKKKKKKKKKKISEAPQPKSAAGRDSELLLTDTVTPVERQRRISYVPLPTDEPPSSERWLVMFLSVFLLIVSVVLFVVLFGAFSREEIELRAGKQVIAAVGRSLLRGNMNGVPDRKEDEKGTEDCYTTATKVLKALSDHNITLKEEKCKFFRDSVVYLGHKVSEEGIYPTAEKIKAVRDAPEPSNITELRAYLGLLNFYGKFLRNLSTVVAPLYELLQKDHKWKWTQQCKKAFEETKEMILNSEVLAFYDVTKPIGLSCDSSAYGLGKAYSYSYHVVPNRCTATALEKVSRNPALVRELADQDGIPARQAAKMIRSRLSIVEGLHDFIHICDSPASSRDA
ncbi:hypothetical protein MTO96_050635 [Rhipicephalus appendiculatus]